MEAATSVLAAVLIRESSALKEIAPFLSCPLLFSGCFFLPFSLHLLSLNFIPVSFLLKTLHLFPPWYSHSHPFVSTIRFSAICQQGIWIRNNVAKHNLSPASVSWSHALLLLNRWSVSNSCRVESRLSASLCVACLCDPAVEVNVGQREAAFRACRGASGGAF